MANMNLSEICKCNECAHYNVCKNLEMMEKESVPVDILSNINVTYTCKDKIRKDTTLIRK